MSMLHKAFIFDNSSFQTELSQILGNALATHQTAELVEFIEQFVTVLKDPDEGEPLDQDWQNLLDITDPHQCGDIALTKFYDPQLDIGLGDNWLKIQGILQQELGTDIVILGEPFGPHNNYFDPGKMGSYFQSSSHVNKALTWLKNCLENKPELVKECTPILNILQKAIALDRGLYITF